MYQEAHACVKITRNTQTDKLEILVKQNAQNGDTTSGNSNTILFKNRDGTALVAKVFSVSKDRMGSKN